MSRQTEIQTLIRQHNRRLQRLKEQRAVEGISVDPKIVIQIEDIEAELEQLRAELATLPKDDETATSTPPDGLSPLESRSSGVTIGNITGGIEDSIIAGRDVHNVTISISSPPPPRKTPSIDELKLLLTEIQQDLSKIATKKEVLQQIAPWAPFTIQRATASVTTVAETIKGKVNDAQSKSTRTNLAEAINLLSRILDNAKTIAQQPTDIGHPAQSITMAMESVVEKLGTASMWVSQL